MNTKKIAPRKTSKAKKEIKKNIAESYNRYKKFGNTQYTGVKIGQGHKWYYDKGVWKDKKVTPDLWEIDYEVVKRRAGKAPEGSGAPVGTEYHWYILAHQFVKKVNANDYTTHLVGQKYKLAHKRFDKEKWNASEKAQRNRLIKLLEKMIADLKKESFEMIEPVKPAKKTVTMKKIQAKDKKVIAEAA